MANSWENYNSDQYLNQYPQLNSDGETNPYNITRDIIGDMGLYAGIASNNAKVFLERLLENTELLDLDQINETVDFNEELPNYVAPTAPDKETFDIPEAVFPPPRDPIPVLPIDWDRIGDIPVFDIDDPNITIPEFSPTVPFPDAPGDAPTVDLNPDFPDPDDFNFDLPDEPPLRDIVLPTMDDLDIPTFEMEFPVLPEYEAPDNTFMWNEAGYSSDLLDDLVFTLRDRINNGGTGLVPEVEAAIWNRARDREEKQRERSKQEFLQSQASRGFAQPASSVTAGIAKLSWETQAKIADLSRDIAIKQAELEQENVKHAITSAIQLEQITIDAYNKYMDRLLDAEKYTVQAAIDIYKTKVYYLQFQIEQFKAYAETYQIRLQAEMAKVDIYKAELDAAKIINDINALDVQIYTQFVEAIKANVAVYTAQVDAAKTIIEAETTKLQAYKYEIDAYTAQIGAVRDEYGMYSERVKGELAKASVYDSQVKAFTSRVQAYAEQVDAVTAQSDAELKTIDADIKQYIARLQSTTEVVKTQTAITEAQVSAYVAKIGAYEAEIKAEGERIGSHAAGFKAKGDIAVATAQIASANATQNINNAIRALEATLEAAKSGAASSTGLAQSALGAINASGSVSGNTNFSFNYERE